MCIRDSSITIGASETATVALQRTHSVGVNETIAIGAAQEIAIGAAQSVSIGAAQSISVGLNTGCALVDGAPHCWGWNTSRGGSDGGLTKAATRVGDLTDVTAVFAGYITGAAIRRGGEVVLWGADFSLESDGGTVSDGRPRPVAGIRRARRVTGGWYHLCALQEDGAVYCWGTGGFGQLARPGTERSGPVRIEGL